MPPALPGAMTADRLLGGRVGLVQPASGYRAAIDPVLLAAAVAAAPGERLVELGCGVGAVALCLLARLPGLTIDGIEQDPLAHACAVTNATGTAFTPHLGDITDPVWLERLAGADQIVSNPPFHDPASDPPPDRRRRAATIEALALADWLAAAARLLRPRGRVTLIHRADRLPELLSALGRRFGAVTILPLWPRAGQPARRVIVAARLGARGPARLLPGLVLHDQAGFTPAAQAVLRDAAALDLGLQARPGKTAGRHAVAQAAPVAGGAGGPDLAGGEGGP